MIFSTYAYLIRVPFFYHAHNLYLQIALEQGLPGLFAFLCLALPLVVNLVKICRIADSHLRPFVLLTLAAAVAVLMYGLLDAELFAFWFAPLLFLPFGCALLLHWTPQHTHQSDRLQAPPLLGRLGWCTAAPLLTVVVLIGQPSFPAKLYANLGAVAQAKAELGLFDWNRWHLQDEVRRNGHANLSSAVQHYEAALALDPDNVTAHERLGQIALANSDYGTALRHLQLVYALAPEREATRQMLGEVFAVRGELGEAAALWRTINPAGDKLEEREWWYDYLGDQH
ncbi:MAG TPA: tetratricopeptide repeat protein, partial [Caldilineaceae bacterium]|nr:tetratricopeptide repeat protein [Caldilineaceae bacterium]